MTNREPAIRRSQKPSSHQSIEAAPAMMRRMGGSAGSPKVSTHISTPFARTILSPDPASRTSESGVVGRSSSLFPVMRSPPLYPCSLKAPAGLAKLPALAESEALLWGDLEDQGCASSAFVVEGSVAHGEVPGVRAVFRRIRIGDGLKPILVAHIDGIAFDDHIWTPGERVRAGRDDTARVLCEVLRLAFVGAGGEVQRAVHPDGYQRRDVRASVGTD